MSDPRRFSALAASAQDPPRLEAIPRPPQHLELELVSRTWPRRAPTSAVLTSTLAVTLVLPLLLHGLPGPLALVLVIPGLLAGVATRVVWDLLAARPLARRGLLRPSLAALGASLVGCGMVSVVGLVLGSTPSAGQLAIGAAATAGALGLAATARAVELRYWASTRRIFFIGAETQYRDLAREVAVRGDLRIVGHLLLEKLVRPVNRAQLLPEVTAAKPTTLVLSAEAIRDPELVAIASDLHLAGARVRELAGFYEDQFAKVALSELSPSWFLFDVAEIHHPRIYGTFKRISETVIAAGGLVLTAPVVPFVVLAVRYSGVGSIFFRQTRVGKDGAVFNLTKFRTMTEDPDAEAGWSDEHSHRIPPVGRFLRRYRIDEIPQLWNILRGQLSLVGPRAEQPEIVARLSQSMEFYAARHRVRPGVTGWAQVNYDYGGTLEGAREKLQYDFYYIKHQGLRLDLVILAATLRTIISGTGR